MRRLLSISAIVALLSSPAMAQSSSGLAATVTLVRHDYAKDADVEVTVALTNGTSHVVDVPAQVLESAVLLVDVRDAAGHHVATIPPPVPRSEVVHFAPGQQRVVKVRLGVFSPPLRAGDYAVGPMRGILRFCARKSGRNNTAGCRAGFGVVSVSCPEGGLLACVSSRIWLRLLGLRSFKN